MTITVDPAADAGQIASPRSPLLPLRLMEFLYLIAAGQTVLFNPTLLSVGSLRVYLCGISWALVGVAAVAHWAWTEDDVLLNANRRLVVACWVPLAAVAVQMVVMGLQAFTVGSMARLLYAPLGIFAAFAVYRRIDRLLDIIVGLVGLECAVLVLHRVGGPIALATRLDPASLGGRNVFGSFLMTLIVLRVSMWAYTRQRPPLYVLVGLVWALAALLLTLTRSPIVGLLGGLAAVSISSLRRRGITGRSLRSSGVILVVTSPLLAQKAVRDRLSSLSFSEASGRGDIWSVAWRFFRERPVVGHGFGSFTATSRNIVEDFVTLAKYGPAQPGIPHPTSSAHNIVLQVLAEGGIIGFAIVAWSVGYLLRTTWHAVILPVLIALFIDSLFATFEYVVQASWVLGLVFAAGLLFRSSEQSEQDALMLRS